ncbi:hypothetical protein [Flagellimonas meridianipacifica]|uniref:Uncharacterized protein n=1 Tax=Flagellimonas meridianipacifica TaxID=1080225 RepID=A0A2T0MGI1_9FLAO|nr:hypothetical protein [Allomuricauda pacifica]PRX56679.1 hypothetical protein CLV81_0676 [Allomuricauda pacifica]
MKKTLFIVMLCILYYSCGSNDDDPCPEVVIDPIVQSIFIELVDNQGNNLIENGTFPAAGITAEFNDFLITGIVFTEVDGLENLITLNFLGSGGETTWLINLNDQVTDTLVLDLSLNIGECGFNTYTLNSALYNGIEQILMVDADFVGDTRIRVVRE